MTPTEQLFHRIAERLAAHGIDPHVAVLTLNTIEGTGGAATTLTGQHRFGVPLSDEAIAHTLAAMEGQVPVEVTADQIEQHRPDGSYPLTYYAKMDAVAETAWATGDQIIVEPGEPLREDRWTVATLVNPAVATPEGLSTLLEVCLGHLPRTEIDRLQAGPVPGLRTAEDEYGWFVGIPEDLNDGLPEDLPVLTSLLHHGAAQGARHLLLDVDGPAHRDLPWHCTDTEAPR